MTKPPKKRNVVAAAHAMRGGAGAGLHHNRAKRATQLPRKRKHKGPPWI